MADDVTVADVTGDDLTQKDDAAPKDAGDPVLRVDGVEKLYRRTAAGHHLRTLKSAILERSLVQGLTEAESIRALDEISFTVERGQAVGVIGSNGSGKSTLLKIIAGILRPTAGTVEVDGRVAALIELGAGFHPEISGRENVYINGAVLGLSKRQIDERYESIVEFSGLADFIEEPVKNYSSGMYVRLGFAVAIHTDPDILMVDEVLAVGDEAFAHKCVRRIEELLARGKTLVLVTHSLALVEEVCDRALWLDRGRIRADGHPRRVIDAYRESVADAEAEEHREAKSARRDEESSEEEEDDGDEMVLRWGSREAEIHEARLYARGEETYHLRSGDDAVVEIEVEVKEELRDFVFGVGIWTPRSVEVWGVNTDIEGYEAERLEAGRTVVRLHLDDLRLAPGEYFLDIAVHTHDGTPYDYRRRLVAFSVTSRERGVGLYQPRHRWETGDRVRWKSTPEALPATASDD